MGSAIPRELPKAVEGRRHITCLSNGRIELLGSRKQFRKQSAPLNGLARVPIVHIHPVFQSYPTFSLLASGAVEKGLVRAEQDASCKVPSLRNPAYPEVGRLVARMNDRETDDPVLKTVEEKVEGLCEGSIGELKKGPGRFESVTPVISLLQTWSTRERWQQTHCQSGGPAPTISTARDLPVDERVMSHFRSIGVAEGQAARRACENLTKQEAAWGDTLERQRKVQ